MAMNSEYRGSASGVAAPKKKAAAKSKTVATPGTKVSQATIDKIKAMGMTKALKGAANASPEMREGLKRLYGASRVAAAMPSKPAAKSADAARSAATRGAAYKTADAARSAASKPAKPVAKSADAARATATKTIGTGPNKAKVTPMSPANKNAKGIPTTGRQNVKKSGTTDPFARFVFGVGRAAKEPFTSKNKKTK